MILFQTLTAYMQQGARCRKALEQRSSKVFEIDEIRFSERILFGCKCKISRSVRVIGHVCVFCSNFFVQEFCTFASKKTSIVPQQYEYISNSDFRKHQDSQTWLCKYPLLFDVSHLHPIPLLPSDVNHLCDVDHLDVVVDEHLGKTGQLGVQEKTEKVEGRRTDFHEQQVLKCLKKGNHTMS